MTIVAEPEGRTALTRAGCEPHPRGPTATAEVWEGEFKIVEAVPTDTGPRT